MSAIRVQNDSFGKSLICLIGNSRYRMMKRRIGSEIADTEVYGAGIGMKCVVFVPASVLALEEITKNRFKV